MVILSLCRHSNSQTNLCPIASQVGSITFNLKNPGQHLKIVQPPLMDLEINHLLDVHSLYIWMLIIIPIAMIFLIKSDLPTSKQFALYITGIIISVFGLYRLVGWERLFLEFHHLFFPQGNFSFPATSILIQLYPDQFWQLSAFFVTTLSLLFILGYPMLIYIYFHRRH